MKLSKKRFYKKNYASGVGIILKKKKDNKIQTKNYSNDVLKERMN